MVDSVKPYINIGPGDIMKDDMEALNWTQKDLAKIIGMSEKTIGNLINNKMLITINTAKLLSKAFGQSPQFWINLDTNYRLRLKNKETESKNNADIKAQIYRR